MAGYIKIPRKLFNLPEWSRERIFSRFEAQLDLLQMAVYARQTIDTGKGITITLTRGQLYTSIRVLAKRWLWPDSRVYRYLNMLKHPTDDSILITIDITTVRGGSIITILDYDCMAENETLIETLDETLFETPKWPRNDTETGICGESETSFETPSETPNETLNNKDKKKDIINTHTVRDYKGGCGGNDEESAQGLLAFVEKELPELQRMKAPLTLIQARWILRKYDMANACRLLSEMHNKRVYERNANVYSTFVTFSKYDKLPASGASTYSYEEMCNYISTHGGRSGRVKFKAADNGRWIIEQ